MAAKRRGFIAHAGMLTIYRAKDLAKWTPKKKKGAK